VPALVLIHVKGRMKKTTDWLAGGGDRSIGTSTLFLIEISEQKATGGKERCKKKIGYQSGESSAGLKGGTGRNGITQKEKLEKLLLVTGKAGGRWGAGNQNLKGGGSRRARPEMERA